MLPGAEVERGPDRCRADEVERDPDRCRTDEVEHDPDRCRTVRGDAGLYCRLKSAVKSRTGHKGEEFGHANSVRLHTSAGRRHVK